MHIHNCSLLIKSVEDRDSGSYRIFAINSEGSAECTASLLVALREEQNPNYLDFVRRSEKTHESIDSLVQKKRESRVKVDLKCVGSPYDKRRENQLLSSQFPRKGVVRTISFERLCSIDSYDKGHIEKLNRNEKQLDKDIQKKLQRLREIKRATRGNKTLSLSSSEAYSDVDVESFQSDTSSTGYHLECEKYKLQSFSEMLHHGGTNYNVMGDDVHKSPEISGQIKGPITPDTLHELSETSLERSFIHKKKQEEIKLHSSYTASKILSSSFHEEEDEEGKNDHFHVDNEEESKSAEVVACSVKPLFKSSDVLNTIERDESELGLPALTESTIAIEKLNRSEKQLDQDIQKKLQRLREMKRSTRENKNLSFSSSEALSDVNVEFFQAETSSTGYHLESEKYKLQSFSEMLHHGGTNYNVIGDELHKSPEISGQIKGPITPDTLHELSETSLERSFNHKQKQEEMKLHSSYTASKIISSSFHEEEEGKKDHFHVDNEEESKYAEVIACSVKPVIKSSDVLNTIERDEFELELPALTENTIATASKVAIEKLNRSEKQLDQDIQKKLQRLREMKKATRENKNLSFSSSKALSDVNVESFQSDTSSTGYHLESEKYKLQPFSEMLHHGGTNYNVKVDDLYKSPEISEKIKGPITPDTLHELSETSLEMSFIHKKKPEEMKLHSSDTVSKILSSSFHEEEDEEEKNDHLHVDNEEESKSAEVVACSVKPLFKSTDVLNTIERDEFELGGPALKESTIATEKLNRSEKQLDQDIQKKLQRLREMKRSTRENKNLSFSSSEAVSNVNVEFFQAEMSSTGYHLESEKYKLQSFSEMLHHGGTNYNVIGDELHKSPEISGQIKGPIRTDTLHELSETSLESSFIHKKKQEEMKLHSSYTASKILSSSFHEEEEGKKDHFHVDNEEESKSAEVVSCSVKPLFKSTDVCNTIEREEFELELPVLTESTIAIEKLNRSEKQLDQDIQKKLQRLREIKRANRENKNRSFSSSEALSDVDIESFQSDTSPTSYHLESEKYKLQSFSEMLHHGGANYNVMGDELHKSPEISGKIKGTIKPDTLHELSETSLESSFIHQKKPEEIKLHSSYTASNILSSSFHEEEDEDEKKNHFHVDNEEESKSAEVVACSVKPVIKSSDVLNTIERDEFEMGLPALTESTIATEKLNRSEKQLDQDIQKKLQRLREMKRSTRENKNLYVSSSEALSNVDIESFQSDTSSTGYHLESEKYKLQSFSEMLHHGGANYNVMGDELHKSPEISGKIKDPLTPDTLHELSETSLESSFIHKKKQEEMKLHSSDTVSQILSSSFHEEEDEKKDHFHMDNEEESKSAEVVACSVKPLIKSTDEYSTIERDEFELELPALTESTIATASKVETEMNKELFKRESSFKEILGPCPPMFICDIESQEVFEGEICTVTCDFHGYPQPTVSWYNNDKPIPRSEDYVISTTEANSTLTFCSVIAQHEGSITCVIFNQYGSDTTSANLKVKRENRNASETLIQCGVLISKHFIEGEEEEEEEEELVTLFDNDKEKEISTNSVDRFVLQLPQLSYDIPCKSEASTSLPVEIKITAPTPVPEYERKLRECFQPVEFPPESTSPDYTSQKMKHTFTFSFDVANKAPKIIQEIEKKIFCKEGDCVLLECIISGDPDSMVMWYKNNTALEISERFNFQEADGVCKLVVKDVSTLDSGKYKCVAKNRAGAVESISDLIVHPASYNLKCLQQEITPDETSDQELIMPSIQEKKNVHDQWESSFYHGTDITVEREYSVSQHFQNVGNVRQEEPEECKLSISMKKVESTPSKSIPYIRKSEFTVSKTLPYIHEKPAEIEEETLGTTGIDPSHKLNIDKTEDKLSESTNTRKGVPIAPVRKHRITKKKSGTDTESKTVEVKPISSEKDFVKSDTDAKAKRVQDTILGFEKIQSSKDAASVEQIHVSAPPDIFSTESISYGMETGGTGQLSHILDSNCDSYDLTQRIPSEEAESSRESLVTPCKKVKDKIHAFEKKIAIKKEGSGEPTLLRPVAKAHNDSYEEDIFFNRICKVETDGKNVISQNVSEMKPCFYEAQKKQLPHSMPPESMSQKDKSYSAVHQGVASFESNKISGSQHMRGFKREAEGTTAFENVAEETHTTNVELKPETFQEEEERQHQAVFDPKQSCSSESALDSQRFFSYLQNTTSTSGKYVPLAEDITQEKTCISDHGEVNEFSARKIYPTQGQNFKQSGNITKQVQTINNLPKIVSCEDVTKKDASQAEKEALINEYSLSHYNISSSSKENTEIENKRASLNKQDNRLNDKAEFDTHFQKKDSSASETENIYGFVEPPLGEVEPKSSFSLTEYLISAGEHEVVLPSEVKIKKENQEELITELEVEDVTFSTFYDFYSNQSAIKRSLSPESDMSIEAGSTTSEDVLDLDKFYTPPSSVERFHSPLSECFLTPVSSPEFYFTPVQQMFDSRDVEGQKEIEHATTPSQQIDMPSVKTGEYHFENLRTLSKGKITKGKEMPPAFIKPLPKKRVYENSTLSFLVEVIGIPTPDVKWYRNLLLLENDKKTKIQRDGHLYILEIYNVQIGESGEYMCNAVNALGEAKSLTQVDIVPHDGRSIALPPPVTHQHVMEFDMAKYTTSRSPSPQEILLEVELDENEVKDFEKQVKIITIPEFSLDSKSMVISLDVLPMAHEEQSLGIATGYGEDVKISFEATEIPPRFTWPCSDLSIPEESNAEFNCSVIGLPKPAVTWFKENVCIFSDGRKYLSQDDGHQSLLIHSVSKADSGTYVCKAVNTFGEVTCKASLHVMDSNVGVSKEKVKELANTSLAGARSMGQNFDFIVDNTAPNRTQAEIELEFEFEGNANDVEKAVELVAVTEQEHEEGGQKCININFDVFAKPSSEAEIEFKADASESCCFEFQVTEAPPKFKKHILDFTASLGTSAYFQCEVLGSPVPNISWYKDGELIQGGKYVIQKETGVHKLIIRDIVSTDVGQYKCVATNKEGIAETNALLKLS
ncbi:uncharacterized protein LOC142499508 [Ascaphus truei]|uniref:uncharacterized protein LOC142499508 n=1 Tax=Ascaphus truei TaxID=8439 RepID=UPI003F5A57B7